MSEDVTRRFDNLTFEERVLAEFAALRQAVAATGSQAAAAREEAVAARQEIKALDARVATLEERVDARLHETRPIWEGIQARLISIEESQAESARYMKMLVADMFKIRARVEKLEDERHPPVG